MIVLLRILLRLLADLTGWLAVLWLATAAIVVVDVLLDTDQGWGVWFSATLPFLIPSVGALVLGCVLDMFARRSN